MTETELIDRLREAIVLDGPDIWRTNGYLQEAQQAGLSLPDALKRAAEISQEVSNNNILFQNIQTRIARLAQPSRAHLIDQDLNQIVNAAASLKLSPDFVRNCWVPAVLQRLTVQPKPTQSEPSIPIDVPQSTEIPPPNTPKSDNTEPYEELLDDTVSSPEPVAPTPPEPPKVTLPKQEPIKEPEPEIPYKPPIVRSFTATPARVRRGQPVTLEWDVENLLAVTIDDLGEGLSPKNRGWVNPTKSMDYTLFDVNNNPLSTVHVDVSQPDRSGIYGVLFALVLLGIIYWFIKSSNSGEKLPKVKPKTEQTTPTKKSSSVILEKPKTQATSPIDEASDTPVDETPDKEVALEPEILKKEIAVAKSTPQPASPPKSPADARQGKYEEAFGDKPYDKVELGADELGWRRARSKGRWGYIDENDEWKIPPEYEAVTPFRGNTAAVFLNGQLMTINRSGEQIRN